jgi:2-iminobutanoate/2-iminopropanoate deaminase
MAGSAMQKKSLFTQEQVPLSKAVLANGLLYLSGDGSIDPVTRELVPGDARAQTRKTLENLAQTLAALGSSLDKVVRTNVYLTDMRDYAAMNEVYGEMFGAEPPARTTVGVASLPVLGLIVEIDLIALP